MKKLVVFSILTFIVGLGLGLYFLNLNSVSPSATMQPDRNFTLYSDKGPINLHDFKSKLVLLFFGYTSCPDVCPLTLNKLAGLLNELSDNERKQVQVLFVSVDPQRDTAENLLKYTQYFHQDIIGLTGSKQQIDKVANLYAVNYKKVEDDQENRIDSKLNYTIDHTASVYVINQQGVWTGLLPASGSVKQWLISVRQLIEVP